MITTDPIGLVHEPFDAANGAVVTFAGVVRSRNDGRRVRSIHYHAYPEMAELEIARLVEEARAEFGVSDATITHRVGEVAVGEASLLVIVRAPHRDAAFAAAQWIITEIKRRVPIWKQECYDDDTRRWL